MKEYLSFSFFDKTGTSVAMTPDSRNGQGRFYE
jgi:hypothetical protein